MKLAKSDLLSLTAIVDALNIGVIVVDHEEKILVWNEWIVSHSDIAQSTAIDKKISDAFSEALSPAFLSALRNTISYGLPVLLSSALHRSPLPLYQSSDSHLDNVRMHQSVTITALTDAKNKRYLLIPILTLICWLTRDLR